jgi:N6-adenosine-specific RNA methylase IME4
MEYKCILIDPPWLERGGGKIKRGADRHYSLLSAPEIVKTVITSGVWSPAADAHLYLWVTNNHLEDGLFVMKALGFRYVTNVCWVKRSMGLGQYFRGQHELLLFGVRGRLPSQAKPKNVRSIIEEEKTVHSRKPQKAYEVIERVSPGPRLELFARAKRDGWTVWGDDDEVLS